MSKHLQQFHSVVLYFLVGFYNNNNNNFREACIQKNRKVTWLYHSVHIESAFLVLKASIWKNDLLV